MGQCVYCWQKAGFLRSKHKECETKNQINRANIINLIESSFAQKTNFKKLKLDIEELANEGFISEEEVNEMYASIYDDAVEKYLDDWILTSEEEDNLTEFREKLNLDQWILDKNGSFQKVARAVIVRDITEWKISPVQLNIVGSLPFNFQKDEKLIWLFQNVEFYEQRTRTEYHGGSVGASVRVAKGLYFRTSSFKGHPVQTQEMKFIDIGMFAITNKNIYFASWLKNFKTDLKKIITINPYEDWIWLQKDWVSSKPQIFKNLDGWFTYNVISNLNN